jgi:excisionase family DNA binding protein
MPNYLITDDDILLRIESKLEQLLSNEQKPQNHEWLTTEQVCEKLSISDRTLQNYINSGIIGSTKLSGRNYFSNSEIEKEFWKNYRPPFSRS